MMFALCGVVKVYHLERLVTMEGQKLGIPEDPSQTLPERSPMDPIW